MNKLFIYSTESNETWKYLGEITFGALSENKTKYELTIKLTPKKYLWALKKMCDGQSLNFLECIEGTDEVIQGVGEMTSVTFSTYGFSRGGDRTECGVDFTVTIQTPLFVKPMTPELNAELTID